MEEGDIVWLNSGGPAMTITAIDTKEKMALCKWFDEDDHLQSALLPFVGIKKVQPE